jgi:hypothetical protein
MRVIRALDAIRLLTPFLSIFASSTIAQAQGADPAAPIEATCDMPEVVGRVSKVYRVNAAEISMDVEIEVKAALPYKLNATAEPTTITDNNGETWKPRNNNILLQSGTFMPGAKRKINYKLFNESGGKGATSLNVLMGFRAFSPEGGKSHRCRFEFSAVPLGSR